MFSLVIFDLDDTILILGVDWAAVKGEVAALAQEAGVAVDKAEHLVPLGNRLSSDPKMKEAIDRIYLRFETECAAKKRYTAIPGMVPLIKELKEKGARLAIASANHTGSIRPILSQLGIESDFDFICGRDSVARNKPAPDQLEMILKALATGRKGAIFIGDSINDENAAKAAGIRFIRVEKGLRKDLAGIRGALGI